MNLHFALCWAECFCREAVLSFLAYLIKVDFNWHKRFHGRKVDFDSHKNNKKVIFIFLCECCFVLNLYAQKLSIICIELATLTLLSIKDLLIELKIKCQLIENNMELF